MQITQAAQADIGRLAQVFFDAVRCGPSPYTEAQRAAWVPQVPSADDFAVRLEGQHIVIAGAANQPQGFMTLRADGYVDFAYVLPDARGQGLFRALYRAIEGEARNRRLDHLSTHASLMAQPAFRAVGFEVMHHEEVERNGQLLARALMEKRLT